jgi:hypothetical protein
MKEIKFFDSLADFKQFHGIERATEMLSEHYLTEQIAVDINEYIEANFIEGVKIDVSANGCGINITHETTTNYDIDGGMTTLDLDDDVKAVMDYFKKLQNQSMMSYYTSMLVNEEMWIYQMDGRVRFESTFAHISEMLN